MKGYVANIEDLAIANEYFRQVLYTDPKLQLVVMSLKPLEEIGLETHDLDQFIRVESGEGKAVLDGEEHEIRDGSVVIVPTGVAHNFINTSQASALKLYTLYTPPQHKDGTIHPTKADALADEHD